MSTRKKFYVWAGVIVSSALLIAWETRSSGKTASTVLAQTDTWTTPTAQRLGVRLIETRDPGGPPAYPVEAGDLLFFTNVGTSYGVVDAKTYDIKTRIPMPNVGDSHGGVFVQYSRGPNGIVAEVVSDQNGFQGGALDAALRRVPPVVAGVR